MQRTFVAITLALALTCAFGYSANMTYSKSPIQVVGDNETAWTNSSKLQLATINAGEIDILAYNYTAPANATVNQSTWAYTDLYRKLDSKALSGNANTTFNYTGGAGVFYVNGYAVTISNDSFNGTNNLFAYQKSISGGNVIAGFPVTSNNNSNNTPSFVQYYILSKTVYVFYLVNNVNSTQVNVSSFTVGGSTKGTNEFTLTATYNSSLSVVWGEALGSSQLYANWLDGTTSTLKYATLDVSKGTATPTAASSSWSNTYTCQAFSTDKKYFGDFCFYANDTIVTYYARFNGTDYIPLNVSNTVNTSAFQAVYPYGPYIAIFYHDSVTNAGNTTFSYDIYNFDSWQIQRNRTQWYVSNETTPVLTRVVSGGLYSITDVQNSLKVNDTTTLNWYSNIQVGLVLGSSSLTSVLGFIMTIVAGVLLF